jgi:hypothetical protein
MNAQDHAFKVNGHCHHLMGNLFLTGGEAQKFGQLYVYDTENEVKNLRRFPMALHSF